MTPSDLPVRPQIVRGILAGLKIVRPTRRLSLRFEYERLFEVFVAMVGPAYARLYQDVNASPDGRALLAEKPDLLALLDDDDYLAGLPTDSLGAAYRDFLRQNRLDAGVFSANEVIFPVVKRNGWNEDFGYLVHRGTVLHDVYHALGGYGADLGGELGNFGFQHGQLGRCGFTRFFGVSFALVTRGAPLSRRLRYWREAVQRGRAARNLLAVRFEDLLARPLDEVRVELGIAPVDLAHPDGHFFTSMKIPFIDQSTAPREPWVFSPEVPRG